MRKIEHIGIAVEDINKSNKLFERILGQQNYKIETVENEAVITSFFQIGDSKIELIAPTNANSSLAKFISKKSVGLHHIAIEVDDIEAEMIRLKSEGFSLVNDVPTKGADNKKICFIHPKETNGVLFELCEGKG